MKHLELFNNGFDDTLEEKLKPENWPYIGYDAINDTVAWSTIVEKEEPLVPGFVDLGLSVMWAECDLGANSIADIGDSYIWGENDWSALPLDSDPVYINSNTDLKEVVQLRTPSAKQVAELLNNTTVTEETVNGIFGYRYTANNGNSIFVSDSFRWTSSEAYKATSISTYEAVCWKPSRGICDNEAWANPNADVLTSKSKSYLFRGVCDYLPLDGATCLKQNQSLIIEPGFIYCFPKTWTSTKFIFNNGDITKIIFLSFPDATNELMSYTFKDGGMTELCLSSKELSKISSKTVDSYVYMKVEGTKGTVMPQPWIISECADKSIQITTEPFSVPAKSSNTVYRLYYEDWKGYDMKVTWMSGTSLKMYIADTCSFFLSSDGPEVVFYSSIAKQKSITIPASTIDGWAERVDADGFLYVRLNCTNQGTITFTTSKPAEVDPTSSEAYSIAPVATSTTSSIDCGCETA